MALSFASMQVCVEGEGVGHLPPSSLFSHLSSLMCLGKAGERLTSEEAQKRLSAADKAHPPNPHYLMVVWEHFAASPSVQTNIDPTYAGNVGRFMNHACDGGNVAPVVMRKRGEGGIRVGMYARCNIVEGEELCFAYGGSTEEGGSQSCTECCCGAKTCTRKLPRESGGG